MPNLIAPINPMPPVPARLPARFEDKEGQVSKFAHPGAFGIDRHEHVHTGVDLYAPYGCPIRAMEAGEVIAVEWFTGPSINMPWWQDTRAVYIEGETGVFNYGEIQEYPGLKVGDIIEQGQYFGYVVTVLKKYKGRPMSMLHVELYDQGYTDTWGEWKIGQPKPEHLKDPTPYLHVIDGAQLCYRDPYLESAKQYTESIT